MSRYLKSYQVVLKTVGPVYIGSGKEIGKKEYIFLNNTTVGIPKIEELYRMLFRKGKKAEFENYLLGNTYEDLTHFLFRQHLKKEEIRSILKYTLDCGDALLEEKKRMQILECMKDTYGMPYVPGSSLKGMLRTILLGNELLKNHDKYLNLEKQLIRNVREPGRVNRIRFMKKEVAGIESETFHTLNKDKIHPENAVNDVMQGFIVSDSEPVSLESLILAQSVEVHTNNIEKNLPLLREAFCPGTEIRFTITIDTETCPFSEDYLLKAIERVNACYYSDFLSAFSKAKKLDDLTVYLGGGSGFASKTIVYPLCGKRKSLEIIPAIFDKIGVSDKHGHKNDEKLGVSPHILKCSRYNGRLYQMGQCRIEKIVSI